MGISKQCNRYRIIIHDVATDKYSAISFNTLGEAVATKVAERAKRAAHMRKVARKAARPQEELRDEHVATFGNNSMLERDFALQLHTAHDKIEVMNDSVVADVCGFFYEDSTLALGIQLKVTKKPRKNNWVFGHTKRYPCQPVVCWRTDMQDGWVFDGTVLDERDTDSGSLNITPGGVNAKLALSGEEPLKIDELIAFLKSASVAGDRARFPPHTKEFLSWQFRGNAHLKERIGLYLEMQRDPDATFPDVQNGSFDLLAGDMVTRKQLKTAHIRKNGHEGSGFAINLRESAGRIHGKHTCRPYDAGVFDEVVVYYFDWTAKLAHVWHIPASKLVERGCLRTATQPGKTFMHVHFAEQKRSRNGRVPDTWTAVYYGGTQPLVLPAAATAAAGHLLTDLL